MDFGVSFTVFQEILAECPRDTTAGVFENFIKPRTAAQHPPGAPGAFVDILRRRDTLHTDGRYNDVREHVVSWMS